MGTCVRVMMVAEDAAHVLLHETQCAEVPLACGCEVRVEKRGDVRNDVR